VYRPTYFELLQRAHPEGIGGDQDSELLRRSAISQRMRKYRSAYTAC